MNKTQDKAYVRLARAAGAFHRCEADGNTEWQVKWEEEIKRVIDDHFPSGSGFDNGTRFDMEQSNDDKLVFHTAYHHMNDGGMYDGWTEHDVIVTPSLGLGYHVKVSGRDRNDIRDYIAEQFGYALDQLADSISQGEAA